MSYSKRYKTGEADGDEYLSGFMKDDRLIPVVTLTVYWGTKERDGLTSMRCLGTVTK